VFKTNPVRAAISANYLLEMTEALAEAFRVLRPGGHMVLVVGNNEVCGEEFRTATYMQEICLRIGFALKLALIDTIKSRGLMTKRNKTASMITREWVLLLEKSQ
jgi:ubiquinone/menaquinone biosynthesis C-methylase UbiE